MAAETPCSVLYDDLKSFGGIKQLDAARVLISTASATGAMLLEKAASNRSYLTRYIVHRVPDRCSPELYGDLALTSLKLTTVIVNKLGGDLEARRQIFEHYRGQAARDMATVLDAFGLDGNLYRNAARRIEIADEYDMREKGTLLAMLFIATGALGDPTRAAQIVETYCADKMGGHFGTTETTMGSRFDARTAAGHVTGGVPSLGLLRMDGDRVDMHVYPLSRSPQGTVVGSLPKTNPSITDVGVDASREHLRIWLEGGHWYVQGLGSTNGTVLEPGTGGERIVVEPPKGVRKPTKTFPPVEIHNSDRLQPGLYTTFLLIANA